MAQQQENVQHSEAKAEVARQKPRDASGKFLSGEALQSYQAQQQQAQFENERMKINGLLGKRETPTYPTYPTNNPIQPNISQQQQQQQPRDNFQNIVNANKPGARSQDPQTEGDKWDIMLGKKRSNIRW